MAKGKKDLILIYEDDQCVIERDRWQYIIRDKRQIFYKGDYHKATYIHEEENLLWELCDCRKFFRRDSDRAKKVVDSIGQVKRGVRGAEITPTGVSALLCYGFDTERGVRVGLYALQPVSHSARTF